MANKMKCKICGQEAIIKLPHYNLKLCKEHFFSTIEKRVETAIKKFRMFSHDDKILVALSGGKDSVALWYILVKLGYKADAVFIKLGHEHQVRPALNKVLELAEVIQRPLLIEDATELLHGFSTFDAAKILRRKTCGFCGKIKRYLMNKVALEKGYDVLTTGHNLDDEVSLILGNFLHWQTGYLFRSYPVLEAADGLVKKAKPLCFNYEEDIRNYVKLRELPYLQATCPFSLGAVLPVYKNLWDKLEENQPSAKIAFYKGFIRNREKVFKIEDEKPNLNRCKICGYPTTGEICSICAAKEKLKEWKVKHSY